MADPVLVALRDEVLARLDGLPGQTRRRYAERGSTGFIYADGEPPSETYLSVPDDVYDDPPTLMAWAEDAVDVARRAKAGRR